MTGQNIKAEVYAWTTRLVVELYALDS